MSNSFKRFSILYFILFGILIINSFVSSILNYYFTILFLIVLLFVFNKVFGFEKDRHRYTKDLFINILIILLFSFLLFYLSGIIIGFMRTDMQYTPYGLVHFLIPYTIILVLKEFLRYQMVEKNYHDKRLLVMNVLFFILLDIELQISFISSYTRYQMFLLIALVVLPSVVRNVVATYITHQAGYKPNMLWILVLALYNPLLPIIPNTGQYVLALLRLFFPLVIFYNVYSFLEKRKRNIPLSSNIKNKWIGISLCTFLIVMIIYFTSGYFRYYVVAIATGSMTPNINKGDVVLLDQSVAFKDLHLGDVLVYRYENKVVVHRINNIIEDNSHYYFYTKGDQNNDVDNYVIYEDMVMGVVKMKIPYIGLPTVWLHELL